MRNLQMGTYAAVAFVTLTFVTYERASAGEKTGLIAKGAEVIRLAGGFKFTEGPACDSQGNIYFSDIRNNRIHKWSVAGKLTTFRENSGGANGLYFNAKGNLLACEGGNRRVTRISLEGEVTVLAGSYNGNKLNSPNDLWIDPGGGVYFTDPRYGSQEGLQQDGFHVYYIPPDGKKPVRVLDDLVKPNGVIGTSDGKLLYVADPGDRKTYVYQIQSDGLLAQRKLFVEEGSDGMTLDEKGNLYLTREAVLVFDRSGERIARIECPERPANVCFGGKARRTLFITARTGFYAIRMNVGSQQGRGNL